MSSPRTNVLSTKVSDEEFAELERAAGGQSIGAWSREVLLNAARQQPEWPAVVLAEVVALRTLVLNLHYAQVAGEITPGQMRELISRADHGRFARAAARLAEATSRSRS